MKPQYLFLTVLVGLASVGGVLGETVSSIDHSSPDPVAAINAAPNIYLAETAYRQAVAADPGNIELYRAYMQQSLAFGRLDQAARAAASLRIISPDNALAWGVMAWQRMNDGDRTEALDFAVRSLALRANNPAVLDLAGRLYAWYDSDSSARPLPDSSVQTLAQIRDSLMTRPAFQNAFNQVKDAWLARGAPASASPAAAPEPVAGPALAAAGLGSRLIPTFVASAFLTPESALQPASPAGERFAVGQSAKNKAGQWPFGNRHRSPRHAPAGRYAVRPGPAMPPGTTVYAAPPEPGQGPNQAPAAPSAGGSPSYSSGGGGSYGSDMGPIFPPNSRFIPSHGGYPGGGPVGANLLQPYLTYPSRGGMVMRLR